MDVAEQVERFRRVLESRGLKFTRQRRTIARVFFERPGHVSLNQILDRARRAHPGIGYATVYRTMRLMADAGIVSEHRFGEAETQYEPNLDGDHHDHLICVECGKIVEFEDAVVEAQQELVAAKYGFQIVSHRHEIYGRCDTCQAH